MIPKVITDQLKNIPKSPEEFIERAKLGIKKYGSVIICINIITKNPNNVDISEYVASYKNLDGTWKFPFNKVETRKSGDVWIISLYHIIPRPPPGVHPQDLLRFYRDDPKTRRQFPDTNKFGSITMEVLEEEKLEFDFATLSSYALSEVKS